jgi:hypothetical protein
MHKNKLCCTRSQLTTVIHSSISCCLNSLYTTAYYAQQNLCYAFKHVSQQCFTAAQESGALELVLAMTRADASGGDALMRLNAMELLPYVAATSAGARFLLVSNCATTYIVC